MEERWEYIPGFDHYRISNLGRLETFSPSNPKKKDYAWRTVKTYTKLCNGNQYACIVIRQKGQRKTRTFYLHRLLYELFVGPIPKGLHIDHKDGDPLNNSLSNLRACTRSQNQGNSKGLDNGLPKGVRLTASGTYQTMITVNKLTRYLGTFETPEQAAEAYAIAAEEGFGEFKRLH